MGSTAVAGDFLPVANKAEQANAIIEELREVHRNRKMDLIVVHAAGLREDAIQMHVDLHSQREGGEPSISSQRMVSQMSSRGPAVVTRVGDVHFTPHQVTEDIERHTGFKL